MKTLSLRQIGLTLLASTALVTFIAPPLLAEDFVVDTATTVTNGGNTIDGGDSLTITETGEIVTAATDGVFGAGHKNVVVNEGTISSAGDGGIVLNSNYNTITNIGSINADDNGIAANSDNTITNSGNITATMDDGILVEYRNTIINSGNIIAGSNGITAISDNPNITNSGSIIAGDNGIDVSDDNIITNNGSIDADDYGIEAGSNNTITNSGSIISGDSGIQANNGNTITNSGSIISGDSGIQANNGNTISNSGSISTSGTNSIGISVDGNGTPLGANIVTNTGTIMTSGDDAYGVGLGNMNTLANSGNIATSGLGAFGVHAVANGNNTLTNSGNITTSGKNAFGVNLLADNMLNNSGDIITSGQSSTGVFADYSQTVNSGRILTSGTNAVGFYLDNGSGDLADPNLVNTGIIHTTGIDATGIYGDTDSVIEHSGYLVSEQSESFEFDNDTQLSLSAPGYIGGAMILGSDAEVHITTGRSHSNLWNFADHGGSFTIDFTGPVPWAYDAATFEFASLDPTALNAAPNVLSDKVGSLSDLLRMKHGGAGADNMVAADLAVVQYQKLIAPPPPEPAPEPVREYHGDWWLAGYGNFADRRASGIYNDYTHLNGGIAAGASFVLDENWDIGGFIGYQASNLVVHSKWVTSQTIFGQGLVGGITAGFEHEALFADLSLYGGFTHNKSDRFVNDNLMPLGVDHAFADYNSFFLAPELRIGANLVTDSEWTITPSASARFSNQWVDGYTETGTNSNATVGARIVQVLDADIELAVSHDIIVDDEAKGLFTLRGGVDYSKYLGPATVDVVLLGQTLAEPVTTAGIFGGYVGAEVNFNLTDDVTFDLGAKGSFGDGNYAVGGSVGISGLF